MPMERSLGGPPCMWCPDALSLAIASRRHCVVGAEPPARSTACSSKPISIRSEADTSLTWNTPRASFTVEASDTTHTHSDGTDSTTGHACCTLRVMVALQYSGGPPCCIYILSLIHISEPTRQA